MVDSIYDAAVSRNLVLLGESPEVALTKSMFHPEKIDEQDAVILSQFYTAMLVSWMRDKDERGLGYFQRAFAEVVASEAYFISTEPGRIWWAAVREFTDPELTAVVDEALENMPVNANRQLLESMLGAEVRAARTQ